MSDRKIHRQIGRYIDMKIEKNRQTEIDKQIEIDKYIEIDKQIDE